ncbi:MAG TPA: RNA 2',3'-cyclic phosphodiesterase [Rhizobacter sp.]|nr:RNA 2',3'-cyclic phosphodiesterase [Rhizobacter sp.]
MPEQLSLPGIEPPRAPTDRLFFALLPDAAAASRIAALARRLKAELGLKGRPLAMDRFHVTLHFFGDHLGLPEGLVAALRQAAGRVTVPPFRLTFDRAGSFAGRPRKRPFVLRGDEGLVSLMAFQKSLGEAMKAVGLGRLVDMRFTPHVTLLYDDRLVPDMVIEPIEWVANEFVLVDSLLGQTRHVPLARWPLST